jgi:hypothetical protein
MAEEIAGTKLSREELFEKVWTTPITEIAKLFSLRDHEIIGLCDKNNIPRPPCGYWSKYRHGFRMERPPLPPTAEKQPITLPPPRDISAARLPSKTEIPKRNSTVFGKREKSTHPLIRKTYRAFSSICPDKTDRLRSKEESLNVYVGYRSLDRAMNFMDHLLKDLEALGHTVLIRQSPTGDQWITKATINKEQVPFHIEETLEPKRTARRNRDQHWLNRDQTLTGDLKLIIDHHFDQCGQMFWSESKNLSLDHRLPQIIDGFLAAAEKIKVSRIAEERRLEEFRAEEEHKRKLEAEERFRKEQIAQLEPCSINWEKANRIRGFISALETAAITKFGALDPESEIAEVLSRARAYADSIDPVIQSLSAWDNGQ